MLFLGKFSCFDLMFDPLMDPMMDALMDLLVNIYVFSSSWSSSLYPSLQCHLLGIRAHDVHGGQLDITLWNLYEGSRFRGDCKLFTSHSHSWFTANCKIYLRILRYSRTTTAIKSHTGHNWQFLQCLQNRTRNVLLVK